MSIDYLTIVEASRLLESKKISSVELTKHYLSKIKSVDEQIHALVTITEDLALQKAAESDARRARGETIGVLDGIPATLKDVFITKDVRTTASSRILDTFIPPYQAYVTALLEKAGMVLLGKTNLDEFAMGTTTEYSAYGETKNPWNVGRVAGGSSGGSAVAVAVDYGLYSLGTDTGGSIRLPAAWNGVVGMRPTYGRVSRNGIIAMASSLDQVGTFTRSVADAAQLLQVIAQPDPLDSTSHKLAVPDYKASIAKDLSGVRIGKVKEYFGPGVDSDIATSIEIAIGELEKLGATVKEVSLPLAEVALAAYCIIVPAEVSTNLERYDGIRYGYSVLNAETRQSLVDIYRKTRGTALGTEVKRRSMLGAYALSAGYYEQYYQKAQAVRMLISQQYKDAFREFDCLVGPMSATSAFKIGENKNDPLKTWMADLLAVPVNIAGLPGISVPCGFDSDGMPIGLQIIADQFQEERIFQVASAFEVSTEWKMRHPNSI